MKSSQTTTLRELVRSSAGTTQNDEWQLVDSVDAIDRETGKLTAQLKALGLMLRGLTWCQLDEIREALEGAEFFIEGMTERVDRVSAETNRIFREGTRKVVA